MRTLAKKTHQTFFSELWKLPKGFQEYEEYLFKKRAEYQQK